MRITKDSIDSRYEIGPELGRGGCGVVYEAVDRHSNRQVALKVLLEGSVDPTARARLDREARSTCAINHPNVCSTLDCGRLDDGRPYVAMERLHGETLRACLSRRGRLGEEDAIEIGVQILAGLEAAHELGIVHRDVKPGNVFIVSQKGLPLIKLMDFGICRRAGDPVEHQTLTVAGSIVGTPGYLAPEQVFADQPIDGRADLFAVGLVLFEMLTGRAAFLGSNPVELAAAVIDRVPPVRAFARVSTLLDRIVAHATEHDRNSRYTTAALFQHDLLEARTALRRQGSHSAAARTAARKLPDIWWEMPTRRMSTDNRRADSVT